MIFTYYIKWRVKIIKLLSAFSVALIGEENFIKAQTPADAGIWATINFELNTNSRTTFFLTEEIRTKEEFRQLDLVYTNIGMQYKISKHLKSSLGYKFKQNICRNIFLASGIAWNGIFR